MDGGIRVSFDLQEGEERALLAILQMRYSPLQVAVVPLADEEDRDS